MGLFRSGQGDAVIVDPGLPKQVGETVRLLARQHPQVLTDPSAPLPRTAGFDYGRLALGARGVLISAVLATAVAVGLSWWMPRMMAAMQPDAQQPHFFQPMIVSMAALVVIISATLELLRARVDGGRAAVARHLAKARGHYLLPGPDLDRATWASAVRARRALASVAASTYLLTSVDGPDHKALAKSFWILAQDMAASRSSAAMDSFAAAVEVYLAAIEAADAISLTPTRSGPDQERHAKAIERADAAGRHAITLASAL
ncbi:hypothetical protein ABT095_14510 [Kitasatospora sp. NPDC002227]|uniref:hypothetical protein n=1 Tax=Kitasatospora sp. NPDC002227 TaxID=3154773 RepID=UPI00332E36FF